MRKFAGLALVASMTLACKKDSTSDAPTAPSTAEVDALWALAPTDARGGIVASPKALGMLEDGLASVRAAIEKAPELAVVKERLDAAFAHLTTAPQVTLADLGMTRQKGAAVFAAKEGEMLAILPVADRDKFLGKVNGKKGATPTDADTIDDITCKLVQQVYACAKPAALLDTLGKGDLKAQLAKLAPPRGDIELFGAGLDIGEKSKLTIATVVQLERGGGTIRGTVVGLESDVVKKFSTASKPRSESASSVSFAVLDPRPFLVDLPTASLDPNMAALVTSLAGPITVTVPPGAMGFDARVPVSDGAPATRLVEGCTSLPGIGPLATLTDGVCHFPIPQANLEVDLWVDPDKKTLRLGQKSLKAGAPVPITRVGRELANGAWGVAFWGRGTVMGASPMPGIPGTVDPQTALVLRALSIVNEVGVAVKLAGDKLEYVATLRTLFANPDAVIAKVLEITPDDIAAARAGDKAKVIAAANAATPFAADYKAGQMGLAIPYMMIGSLAAVAIPAFMDYMKKSKKSEAAILLNKLAKSSKVIYAENSEFPKLDLPLTPSTSCCGSPDNKCQPNPADWTAWQPLDFEVTEPSLFQYSYKSDGKTVTAQAVGDLDCDGTSVTYELRGRIDTDQTPVFELVPPPPNSD